MSFVDLTHCLAGLRSLSLPGAPALSCNLSSPKNQITTSEVLHMALPLVVALGPCGSGVAILCFHHPSFTQLSILLVVLAFGSSHPLLVIAFDIIFLLLDVCLVASLSLSPS